LTFMLLIQEKFGPDTRKVFEKMEQAAQHPDIAGLKAVWKKLIVAADVRRLTSKSEIKMEPRHLGCYSWKRKARYSRTIAFNCALNASTTLACAAFASASVNVLSTAR
jgi:hypothetical protein